nr:SprT family zinc-dependent metalloprotease [Oceanipulchritudo coccoides]
MNLHVDSSSVVVLKAPLRQSQASGVRFMEEHGDWICRMLETRKSIPKLHSYLMKHPHLSLAGRSVPLVLRFKAGVCQHVIEDTAGRVILTVDPGKVLVPQLVSLLKSIAREFLPTRLMELARKHQLKPHGITVRNQKSRWGSCSETGAISLNWRLVLLSPPLQDHVLLHELAHLKHFDHSKGFHQFLKALDPSSEKHARRLDADASLLIDLGQAEL